MSGFIGSLLFPEICPLCEKNKIIKEQGCCDPCRKQILYSEEKAVLISPEFVGCADMIVCASYYGGKMRDAMEKFKFRGETYIGKSFGKMIYSVIKDNDCINNTDVVTAVPVSPERFKERGYNQSFLIAKEFCRLTGLPYQELLVRNAQGKAQSKLLLEDRQTTVEERFSIKKDCRVKGSSVLLIDDILTTGSTVNKCAKLLKSAGAGWVTVACATSGRKDFG